MRVNGKVDPIWLGCVFGSSFYATGSIYSGDFFTTAALEGGRLEMSYDKVGGILNFLKNGRIPIELGTLACLVRRSLCEDGRAL